MRAWVRGVVFMCCCVAAGTAFSPVASGQDVGWMRVDVVQVVPEKLDEYIELQLEEVNPGLQRAGVPWRSAWRTAEFGQTYQRVFVAPIENLADYDSGGPLARALEPDRLARLIDRLRRCSVSRESYAVRYRADLSIEAEDVGELFLARVTAVEVAPGRTAEWEAFLEEYLPQFRGADVVFGIYQRVFGPGPPIWQIVENHSSFAELNQPSIIARTFGDQASEVAGRYAGVLTSIERTVLRYDAELSYSTSPQQEGR